MKVTLVSSLDLVFDLIYLWTDSKTVMQYITNNNSKYSSYVMHRVNKVKSNTGALLWRYIPGNLNPVDDATSLVEFKEIHQNSRWLNGPEFFKEDLFEEPVEKETFNNIIIPGMEEIPEKNKTTLVLKWEHFSSWSKLIYHVSALLKIKSNWLLCKNMQMSHLTQNTKLYLTRGTTYANPLLKPFIEIICMLAGNNAYQFPETTFGYQTVVAD